MRPRVRAFTFITTLTLFAASAGAAASWSSEGSPQPGPSAAPRYQLEGDWRLDRQSTYRIEIRGGKAEGRVRRTVKVGGCTLRKGSVMFSAFRFAGTSDSRDLWKGQVAVAGRDCRRTLVPSTIAVLGNLRFEEGPRVFRRVRPKVRASDPIVGTWLRNNAGIVVTAGSRHYEGRAREAFLIPNGCTVPAGTLVWTIRPLAPGSYDGRIPTFLPPPGCHAGKSNTSAWTLSSPNRLIRRSQAGGEFEYLRG
jgi:hypothetical protein